MSLQQLAWYWCNQVLNSSSYLILFLGNYTPNTIVGTPTASPATLSVGPQDVIETLAVNGIEALEGYGMEI